MDTNYGLGGKGSLFSNIRISSDLNLYPLFSLLKSVVTTGGVKVAGKAGRPKETQKRC